jgi:hypothetical protein
MKRDLDPKTATAKPGDAEQAASNRAELYRERFRQAQAIAAQVARARGAGGTPSDAEAARLVAEFHARGGRVTVCPEAEPETPPDGGRAGRGNRD